VFRGTYEHAIDGKGRTSFPSKFRELLGGEEGSKLVLTIGLEPCVLVYPLAEWKVFEARLRELPNFDTAVRDLKRMYFSNAQDVELDGVGRMLIPAMLRDYANLRRDAVWAGNDQVVELWDKEAFNAARQAITQSPERRAEMARRLAELGL
jgi:MraZ protein